MVRRDAVLPHQNAAVMAGPHPLPALWQAAGRTLLAICSRRTKWLHPS